MPLFVIEVEHTAEEHERAVAETLRTAPESQMTFLWSCGTGSHKAWAFVEASGTGEAREVLPSFLRERGIAHRVERYSVEDVPSIWDEAA